MINFYDVITAVINYQRFCNMSESFTPRGQRAANEQNYN